MLPPRKLGEFFRLKHGYAFKGEFFSDSGPYVLLTPGNFHDDGGFKLKGSKEKYYTGPFPSAYLLEKDSLIIAMTEQAEGLLGSSAWIPEGNRFLHNQRLGLVVDLDETKMDRKFLYYLFNTKLVRAQIRATANGAKVRHTSPARVYEVEATIPCLSSQRRIASVLSAYDDLIENNTRRIAILEEVARRLYEEWFVQFRFPGHEGAAFIETEHGPEPEGWKWQRLKGSVEFCYGKALKATERVEGPFPVYGSSGVVGSHEGYLVEGPGLIVGRKGNVGSVHWSAKPFYPIDTTYYVKTDLPLEYVYHNLLRQNFLNNDAAVPGLNREQAYSLPFLLPSPRFLKMFTEQCRPLLALARQLERVNANLRAQRDLLLPKLISGEIDVSSLPLPSTEDQAA